MKSLDSNSMINQVGGIQCSEVVSVMTHLFHTNYPQWLNVTNTIGGAIQCINSNGDFVYMDLR